MKNKKIIYALYLLVMLYACDHGIEPKPTQTGISGTIYYNNWPPLEQIIMLKLVVFREFPPENIIEEVTHRRAVFYPEDLTTSLPLDVDSTFFLVEMDTGSYQYIVVAQQYGTLTQWLAVGQYDTTLLDPLPTEIMVYQDEILSNINIYVDFDSLPIQPFKVP